jgi:hypothetical protein
VGSKQTQGPICLTDDRFFLTGDGFKLIPAVHQIIDTRHQSDGLVPHRSDNGLTLMAGGFNAQRLGINAMSRAFALRSGWVKWTRCTAALLQICVYPNSLGDERRPGASHT